MSSVLPLININVCTKFSFNPFSTFQDMAWTGIHYEQNKWLRADNSVNIQGRIMALVHCPSSHCQVSFKSKQYFSNDVPAKITDRRTKRGEHNNVPRTYIIYTAVHYTLYTIQYNIIHNTIQYYTQYYTQYKSVCVVSVVVNVIFYSVKLSFLSF